MLLLRCCCAVLLLLCCATPVLLFCYCCAAAVLCCAVWKDRRRQIRQPGCAQVVLEVAAHRLVGCVDSTEAGGHGCQAVVVRLW